MSSAGGKKPGLLVFFILLGAQAALSQTTKYTVHLLSPWKDDPTRNAASPAIIEMVGSDGPGGTIPYRGNLMTPEGGDWYVASVNAPATDLYKSWKFTSYLPNPSMPASDPNHVYGPSVEMDVGGYPMNLDSVFARNKWTEVWIIPQGPGKRPIITDIPPKTKVVYLLNPWALGAPAVKTAKTDWKNMRFSEDKTRCGWYVHYITDSSYVLNFRNIVGGETFGSAGTGVGNAAAYDLTAFYASNDTAFLVPDPQPGGVAKVLPAFPEGTLGICSFPLAVTVRDFSGKHPDFEQAIPKGIPDRVFKGMVETDLGPDNKPVFVPGKHPLMNRTGDWFNTTPAATAEPYKNYQECVDLPISKDLGGYWTYSSLESSSGSFFPIDGAKDHWPAEDQANCVDRDYVGGACNFSLADGNKHNFSFCMEMQADFTYKKGQQFSFIGDDDVWVFINKKLVIDLGGTHSPAKDSVNLDLLGLTEGSKNDFRLFYCERQHSGSNLYIKTSIYFEQKRAVYHELVAGSNPPEYDIWERSTGDKSCGSVDSGTVALAPSVFKLSGPNIPAPVVLPNGTSHGGITISATKTQVAVDTSKINDLKPGVYTITYLSEASGRGGSFTFTITGNLTVEFAAKPAVEVLAKTAVPVTVRAMLNGVQDLRAETFTLAPQAGLLVYADSGLTVPIAAGTELSTDATTGLKKVWVTSNATGTYKIDLSGNKSADSYPDIAFKEVVKAAMPTATPPGMTFSTPITVLLASATPGATILYTTDGSDPDSAGGGTTRTFTGAPLSLDASRTIKAIAIKAGYYKSDIMTAVYVYARPAKVTKAYYKDLDGDGHIETAIVQYDEDLAAVPEKLAFKVGAPADQELTARNDQKEIAFAAGSRSRIVVTFSNPFPFGVTSVADPANSGHQFDQPGIPLLDGAFPVDDSVPPVIVSAEVKAPDSLQPYVRVIVAFSEVVTLPLGSQMAIVFKRDNAEMAPGEVKLMGIKSNGGPIFELDIDSTSAKFPIVGDFAAANTNGEITDAGHNAPASKAFMILTGEVPKGKAATVYVTFANGTHEAGAGMPTGSEPTTPADVIFIPFDKAGAALSGNPADGKCLGCFVGTEGHYVGAVVYMEIPGPVEYDFKIFSNTGEFVATGKGRITEEDIPGLAPIHNGTAYLARVVWTGRTVGGGKAGTGAYVLISTVRTQKNFKTGAPPATATERIRFGLLRNYRGG